MIFRKNRERLNILEKTVNKLEKQVDDMEKEIWESKNPCPFKIGQHVKLKGIKSALIVQSVETRWIMGWYESKKSYYYKIKCWSLGERRLDGDYFPSELKAKNE